MEKWVKCPDCKQQIAVSKLKAHVLSCKKYKANFVQNTTKLVDHLNQGYLEFLMVQIEIAKDIIYKKINNSEDKVAIRKDVQDFEQLFSQQKNNRECFQEQNTQKKSDQKQKIQIHKNGFNERYSNSYLFDSTVRLQNPWQQIQKIERVNNDEKIQFQNKKTDGKIPETDQKLTFKQVIDFVQCENCNKNIDARNVDQFAYTYNCCHFLCIQCLKSYIQDQYVKSEGSIKCLTKGCKQEIPAPQIKQIIGMPKFQQLQNQLVRMLINKMDVVKCKKCNNEYQFVEGKHSDAPKKDSEGKKIPKNMAEHFAKNRFLCPNLKCKQEQCRECNESPYHLGMLCQQNNQYKMAKKCRYCRNALKKGYTSNKGIRAFDDVCNKKQCQKIAKGACSKILKCKHPCLGYISEKQCLPCLNEQCSKKVVKHDQNENSYCGICYVEDLKSAPCVISECGHIFHYRCAQKRLQIRWLTPRITLDFCLCPLCKQWLQMPNDCPLTKQVQKFRQLDIILREKSLKRLKHEKLQEDIKITQQKSEYYNKPTNYAMAIYAYFECFKCKKPYFGGRKNCAQAMENESIQRLQSKQFDASKLVCPECCPIDTKDCPKHGKQFISFKCRFCCNIAQWFCWGSTHFCDSCHSKQLKGEYLSKMPKDKLPRCQGPDKCPVGGNHKENGQQYNLGCILCRNYKKQISQF